MTALIGRNTTVPVKKSQVFSTAEDNQAALDIQVLQGERPMAAGNMALGHFRLEGIPAAPLGQPQIEVTFDIDADGILNATAHDEATGREQKSAITASTNLGQADVERMVNEAKKNEAADRKRKELIEARNQADSLAYAAEQTLRALGDKVPGRDRQHIEDKIAVLREALNGEDVACIRRWSGEVRQANYALSQQRDARQQQNGWSGGAPEPPVDGRRDGGEVLEGEFQEA